MTIDATTDATAEYGGCAQLTVGGDEQIRIVTLNSPEYRNSLDQEMTGALHTVLENLADDRRVRAVVLTGAGDRAFCAGGRRDEFDVPVDERRRRMRQAARTMETLVSVHVPVIAAVNGPAVGLGATLAVACDLVVMSDQAFLADTHVAVGLVAGDGGAVAWPLHIGLLRAKEYLLTGERIPATVAKEIGLANRVVAPAQVLPTALEIASKLAAAPAQGVQDTKMVLNQHLRTAMAHSLRYGLAAETISMLTLHANPSGAGE